MKKTIGVLALQGDFKEHGIALKKCNAQPKEIRLPQDLENCNGLIIPGGESTTITKLMMKYGLDKAIKKKHAYGMKVWGTCAGSIILSRTVLNGKLPTLNLIDMSIKRNDYGRQVDSFETELSIKNIGKLTGVFIRAPVISQVGKNCEVLSSFNKQPVMVQENNVLITTFHPEMTDNLSLHTYFLTI